MDASWAAALVIRDDADAGSDNSTIPSCSASENDTSQFGLRIASIFVVLVGSFIGAIVPIWLARTSVMKVPKLVFFVAKYFGSGVILATAWMHLLAPATEELGDPCLAGILPDYDWAEGIALMTVMVMFLIELVVAHFDIFSKGDHHGEHGSADTSRVVNDPSIDLLKTNRSKDVENGSADDNTAGEERRGGMLSDDRIPGLPNDISYPPGGKDHLGHRRSHTEGDSASAYAAQMTGLFILEFGVIFHSIFIGLTLALSNNFVILFIVIVFHQTFEGLGLGARLATARWPADRRRWTPYIMGSAYAITTPLAIGIGLGLRESLDTGSATMLVASGVFDAISAGILMYTALVELLAHEFMFNPEMRNAGLSMQLFAYSCVAVGVGLMALLAKWA